MVIADGRAPRRIAVTAPTQLVDLFPTLMDLARVDDADRPAGLDGASLAPLLRGENFDRTAVVSQFHGCDTAMSWFLAVAVLDGAGGPYKLVQWGTGAEHAPLLFDLGADPDEVRNREGKGQGPCPST